MYFSFLQGKACASQTFSAPDRHRARNMSRPDKALIKHSQNASKKCILGLCTKFEFTIID